MQVTVGGLVRSYKFRYTEGEPIAQGTMYVQLNSGNYNFSATMVILGGSEEDAMTAERIVAETHNISDCSGAVVEAYFSAYCFKINRYIVVYEPFQTTNPPESFLTQDSLNLSVFWRDQVRCVQEKIVGLNVFYLEINITQSHMYIYYLLQNDP